MLKPYFGIGSAVVILLLTSSVVAETHSTVRDGVVFRTGDVIFLHRTGPLGKVVQGLTRSPFDHCGIVVVDEEHDIEVVEASIHVQRTSLHQFLSMSKARQFHLMRPSGALHNQVESVVEAAEQYIGSPYDTEFELNDEKMYCSELVWRAYQNATGTSLAETQKLGELAFLRFVPEILYLAKGSLPLNRTLVSPAALSRSPHLERIYSDFEGPGVMRW